jgi:hypothetical protein
MFPSYIFLTDSTAAVGCGEGGKNGMKVLPIIDLHHILGCAGNPFR